MELPLSRQNEESVHFNISPQPVFNKNFELLTEDIRKRLEEGYRVRIYGEKQSQLERLSSILSQNGAILPRGCPPESPVGGDVPAGPGAAPRSHGAEPQSRRATVWLSSVRGGPPALLQARRAWWFRPQGHVLCCPFLDQGW